jgi:V/A-type H+-transporting ATPase subunit E
MEMLRQEIEKKLFEPTLEKFLCKEMAKPEVIADLVNAIARAIEKEGLGASLEVTIPKKVPASDVSAFLVSDLKNTELSLGEFLGGAKVKISDKNMSIEITDKVVKELVSSYVRKDFREHIFQ